MKSNKLTKIFLMNNRCEKTNCSPYRKKLAPAGASVPDALVEEFRRVSSME